MKYLLFDLDGTLSDSSLGITNCIAAALSDMGIAVEDRASLKRYIGPPLTTTFGEYFTDPEDIAKAVAGYRKRYSVTGWKENRLYDGIRETLKELAARGYRLVMATSKPERYARPIAELFEIDKYFYQICGASMDGRINSKEQVIEYALGLCKVTDEDEVTMIGDRYHDVEGAAVFGIPTIGVTYGFGTAEELLVAGAKRTVDRPEELLEIF